MLHNFWSHIYDFTPTAANNWYFLPSDGGGAGTGAVLDLLGPLPKAVALAAGEPEGQVRREGRGGGTS